MILDRFALTGKVAVVTGAGRGIGKGIALAFAEAGADLALVDITLNQVEKARSEIEGLGRRALAIACDVREADQIDLMVSRAKSEFGHIDVLVNNAGGTPFKPTLKTSLRTWEAIIRQNLTTTFLCSKAVSAVMLEQKAGSIINISSRDSQIPSLAWELAPHVRVNAILPGAIWTEGSGPVLEPIKDRVIANTPLGRIGTPQDIALAAIYLASSASEWVTGKLFEIDGGMEFVPAAAEEMGKQS